MRGYIWSFFRILQAYLFGETFLLDFSLFFLNVFLRVDISWFLRSFIPWAELRNKNLCTRILYLIRQIFFILLSKKTFYNVCREKVSIFNMRQHFETNHQI